MNAAIYVLPLSSVSVRNTLVVHRNRRCRCHTEVCKERAIILTLLGTDEAKLAGLVQEVFRVVLGRDAGNFLRTPVWKEDEFRNGEHGALDAYI